RASREASPTVFLPATVPLRWAAPVIQRMLSRSVVLPDPKGPTRATQRGPLPPFFLGIAVSLTRVLLPMLALLAREGKTVPWGERRASGAREEVFLDVGIAAAPHHAIEKIVVHVDEKHADQH